MTLYVAFKKWHDWLDNATTRAHNTKRMYRSVVKRWIRYSKLGVKGATAIDDSDIHRFINRRSNLKLSSRKMELKAIKAFCKFMQGKGCCRGNPAILVEIDYSLLSHEQKEVKHKTPFTEAEYQTLLSRADPFWKAMMTVARHTGLRLGDCVQLEWGSVASDMSHLIVWTAKHDKRVELPLPRAALDAMREFHAGDLVYVFPAQRQRYLDRDYAFNLEFWKLTQEAGILDKTFHCFRAMYLTEVAHRDGIAQAAKYAGHSSTKTTEVYVNA